MRLQERRFRRGGGERGPRGRVRPLDFGQGGRRGGDRARRGRAALVEGRDPVRDGHRREPRVLGGQRGDPPGGGLGRPGGVIAPGPRLVQAP